MNNVPDKLANLVSCNWLQLGSYPSTNGELNLVERTVNLIIKLEHHKVHTCQMRYQKHFSHLKNSESQNVLLSSTFTEFLFRNTNFTANKKQCKSGTSTSQ